MCVFLLSFVFVISSMSDENQWAVNSILYSCWLLVLQQLDEYQRRRSFVAHANRVGVAIRGSSPPPADPFKCHESCLLRDQMPACKTCTFTLCKAAQDNAWDKLVKANPDFQTLHQCTYYHPHFHDDACKEYVACPAQVFSWCKCSVCRPLRKNALERCFPSDVASKWKRDFDDIGSFQYWYYTPKPV